MVEDSPFVKEAMRLAGLYATAWGIRARAEVRGTDKTKKQLDLSVAKARDRLRNYLIKGEQK